jgi:hypothetical protein
MGKWLSKAAVLWALYEAPDVPARLVSTLIAVAVYAGEDGSGAYPSGATVAMLTRKSESQAKRDMAECERLGLLLPGDGRIVEDIRADRRPKVYDLPMPRGASGRPPPQSPRGASGNRTGRIPLQNGGRPDAPEEFLKNSRTGARPNADAPRAEPPDPPWCGECIPGDRMTVADKFTRCPKCNPLAAAYSNGAAKARDAMGRSAP